MSPTRDPTSSDVFTHLRGHACQLFLRTCEALAPTLFVSQFIKDQRGDRILLGLGELLNLMECLFQLPGHRSNLSCSQPLIIN